MLIHVWPRGQFFASTTEHMILPGEKSLFMSMVKANVQAPAWLQGSSLYDTLPAYLTILNLLSS